TDKYAQAYFAYDSKKSGGITISHLRFGDSPIQSTYLIDSADFIACHNPAYVTKYDMVSALKDGGTFLLNSPWTAEEMEKELPASMKQLLAKKHAKFYTIDAIKLAKEVGMGGRINTIMQAAFFKLADIIPYDKADEYMKAYAKKTYGKKGDEVVKKNWDAIDIAISGLVEIPVPEAWANATTGAVAIQVTDDPYFKTFIEPILAQDGNKLPVSLIDPAGRVPTGTTKYEKRGIAVTVPEWNIDSCIQCGTCAIVCPHACIRPYLLTEEEAAKAPASFEVTDAKGKAFEGLKYRMQVSVLDCTGCENCTTVCPVNKGGKKVALEMKPLHTQDAQEANWEFAQTLPEFKGKLNVKAVKDSQFKKPLFEFSGACAGCGETPYVKLVTQLFGDRMIIANATGCSSIYGGSAPTCPYTKNEEGHGPAWANSLFEDNAEFGFGMNLGITQRREKLADNVRALAESDCGDEVKAAAKDWLKNMDDAEGSKAAGAKLVEQLKGAGCCECTVCKAILDDADLLTKKSFWIFGGDGWAYDIGYGGLDHVLAQGEDVNVLVLDTEVYSNTGGQASKSSPHAAVAKFAAAGKRTKKK
ncbi:MAG: 2-oxoacid:acceptor oxidoreductase family protein, partial [Eubacteriales bacterium]